MADLDSFGFFTRLAKPDFMDMHYEMAGYVMSIEYSII